MKKQFIMRGQTASSGEEVLNFTGHKEGFGFKLIEFEIYPSTNLGGEADECFASITSAKVASDPINPNFDEEGLIGTAMFKLGVNPSGSGYSGPVTSIINTEFIITQNLRLSVRDTDGSSPVNWQCKFESVKLNASEEAVTNFKQFSISDG